MSRWSNWLCIAAVGLLMATSYGCGKKNIFGWAHNPGDNKDTQSLMSDGTTALQNKDYQKALECFQKALENDSSNSEAIYGYSAARLAQSGIDIADLIANLVRNTSGQAAPGMNGLAPALSYAAGGSSDINNLLPPSVIDHTASISQAVNEILSPQYLYRIVSGHADGRISPENPDVNLNIAFCLLLRAALRVQDANVLTFTSNYEISSVDYSNPQLQSIAQQSAQDIASAYQRMLLVARQLNLADDSTISKVRGDMEDLFNRLKNELGSHGVDISGISLDVDYYGNGGH